MQRFPLSGMPPPHGCTPTGQGAPWLASPAPHPPHLSHTAEEQRTAGSGGSRRQGFGELSLAKQPAAWPQSLSSAPPHPAPPVSAPGTAKYLLKSFWTSRASGSPRAGYGAPLRGSASGQSKEEPRGGGLRGRRVPGRH